MAGILVVGEIAPDGSLTKLSTEAATLARDMGAQIVIPCHYEMFEFNTASPDEFIATAEHLQQPYKVFLAGEHWDSSTLN